MAHRVCRLFKRRLWRPMHPLLYLWEEWSFQLQLSETTSSKLGIFLGKRTGVAPTRQKATLNMQKQYRTCVKCGKIEGVTGRHVCCSQCHASWYCSKSCQQEHWREYKILCEARREMETPKQSSTKGKEELIMSFPAHLTPPQHLKLTKLVRRRCIVSCLLKGKKVDALWDMGAQVRIILKHRTTPIYPMCQREIRVSY